MRSETSDFFRCGTNPEEGYFYVPCKFGKLVMIAGNKSPSVNGCGCKTKSVRKGKILEGTLKVGDFLKNRAIGDVNNLDGGFPHGLHDLSRPVFVYVKYIQEFDTKQQIV
ncbi:hypothetical protein FACS1894200_01250 [Spirochaetia bacterium]|nr:hypothetical protein FACS1894200_01250 [Spirochaetia bacterium]